MIGSDILMCIEGGDRPHIGCTVQAISRKSLTGSGENSVTSSVINVTGHKDEFLCRKAAEAVCSALGNECSLYRRLSYGSHESVPDPGGAAGSG